MSAEANLDLGRHNALLHELALLAGRDAGDLKQSIEPVLAAVAKALDVVRVGIWLYADDRAQALACACLHDTRGAQALTPTLLVKHDFPRYFAALDDARCLAAENVLEDARTAELRAGYLIPLGIRAMLDAAVVIEGQTAGIICCEDVRGPRVWSEVEQSLVGSVGDLVGTVLLTRKLAEQQRALQRSEEMYRRVVEDQDDIILRSDARGRVVFANRATLEFLFAGEPPADLGTMFRYVPEDDHAIIRTHAERLSIANPVMRYEHRVKRHDGECLVHAFTVRGFFSADGKLEGYQAIGRDMTEAREREAKLREAQRIEALAILSGGIAHDFNNILVPIGVLCEHVLQALPSDSRDADDLRKVLQAADRAKDLVRRILVFGRKSNAPPFAVNVGGAVRETLGLARSAIPKAIAIDEQVDTDCGSVFANASDLYQVVSNLCTNALQAMPAGGRLTVSVSKVRRPPNAERETHVQILVRDTGVGMSPEVRERIFEPFYTTKGTGGGTGLGLAMVHGIVTQLNGSIDVQSQPGLGTTFVVVLPLIEDVGTASGTSLGRQVGVGRFLVVDDDPAVTHSVTRLLESLGASVTSRQSVNEALVELGRRPKDFQGIISDLTMPQASGVELAWRARQLRSDIPIVLMSGFTAVLADADRRLLERVVFLDKPFTRESLADALSRAVAAVEAP